MSSTDPATTAHYCDCPVDLDNFRLSDGPCCSRPLKPLDLPKRDGSYSCLPLTLVPFIED